MPWSIHVRCDGGPLRLCCPAYRAHNVHNRALSISDGASIICTISPRDFALEITESAYVFHLLRKATCLRTSDPIEEYREDDRRCHPGPAQQRAIPPRITQLTPNKHSTAHGATSHAWQVTPKPRLQRKQEDRQFTRVSESASRFQNQGGSRRFPASREEPLDRTPSSATPFPALHEFLFLFHRV